MSARTSCVQSVRVLRVAGGSAFVEVLDGDGVAGLFGPLVGEATAHVDALAPVLIGRPVSAHEENWERMFRAERHGRGGANMIALAALDCALWDLHGKLDGRPVFELLGGPTRDAVPAYASLLGYDAGAADAGVLARRAVEDGFAGQKWALRDGPSAGADGLRRNVELTRALRAALGPYESLAFDALGGWTAAYARDYCRRVVDCDLAWLEEPLPPEDLRALASLARECDVPLAAGEHAYTRHEADALISRAGVRVLQTDVSWSGGLTEAVKVATLCSLHGVALCPHGAGLIPALHLAAAQPAAVVPMVEYHLTLEPVRQEPLARRFEPRQGSFALPAEPGLGIALRDEGSREPVAVREAGVGGRSS